MSSCDTALPNALCTLGTATLLVCIAAAVLILFVILGFSLASIHAECVQCMDTRLRIDAVRLLDADDDASCETDSSAASGDASAV